MNPINLQVTFLDETVKECVAIAADLIAFEAKFDLSIARLEKELRITHMFFIAWHVTKRTGQTTDDFEKWVEGVAMVSVGEPKKLKG
jgi:hypothetical protein